MTKTTVKEAEQCPSCGKATPAGTLAGLCPTCLLARGAESDGGSGSARFEPLPLPEVARLFPQLEILDLLGAGGMGAVYKARQPALDRIVALKILPATGPGGANFAERFNREARALARLNHPNIVAVFEFGQAGGLHYFLMEFVDGANLRLLEQGSRLSPREALQIIPQICDALQYAHDQGVVHRDIKPENVLVDRKGRVKIADFGLAKILGIDADATRLTAEGQVMGTLHYMAPEQVARPLAVDHRADIYSLGVVLYEMLTGDLPLGKFSPPSQKVQVDVRFDEVVLRALENDPAARYQRASEVKTKVETISGTPVAAAAPQTVKLDGGYLGWFGFAVVLDRTGRRAVNWKGTIAALGVTFGLLTLVFAFGTALTGGSVLGWIGVVGWPSVVVRIVLTLLFVGWGVQSALHSKRTVEFLSETSGGTVILPSSRRGWLIGRRVVIAGVMVLAWCAFQTRWLTPWLNSRYGGPHVAGLASPDARTGLLEAKPSGSGVVELLAASDVGLVPEQKSSGWSVGAPDESGGRTVAGLPPVIVSTDPVAGARNVAPGVSEIRVRFSKDMADGGWSWTDVWPDSAPEIVGQPRFESDRRTCVITARLQPGRMYGFWLNSEKFRNFADTTGQSAIPYLLTFQTRVNP